MMIIVSSLWLGILTSISPCPLTTNIVAVSFLGRRVDTPAYVLLCGLLYTLGRTFFYTALGLILFYSMDAIPEVSMFLQKKANYVLAPLLVLIGLVLLNVIKLPFAELGLSDNSKKILAKWGLFGSFILGVLFAAALCPVSAALFFGNMIQNEGSVISLILYGIGTGVPVLLFSVVIAFAVNKLANIYKAVSVFERYARILTGLIFIEIGFYYGRIYIPLIFN